MPGTAGLMGCGSTQAAGDGAPAHHERGWVGGWLPGRGRSETRPLRKMGRTDGGRWGWFDTVRLGRRPGHFDKLTTNGEWAGVGCPEEAG